MQEVEVGKWKLNLDALASPLSAEQMQQEVQSLIEFLRGKFNYSVDDKDPIIVWYFLVSLSLRHQQLIIEEHLKRLNAGNTITKDDTKDNNVNSKQIEQLSAVLTNKLDELLTSTANSKIDDVAITTKLTEFLDAKSINIQTKLDQTAGLMFDKFNQDSRHLFQHLSAELNDEQQHLLAIINKTFGKFNKAATINLVACGFSVLTSLIATTICLIFMFS